MIGFLKGEIEFISSNYILLNINNVGYKVYVSENTLKKLMIGENKKFYTYTRVAQDDISLYGFLTNEELVTFELIITVGGIGAKSAISILSNTDPASFALYVITEDVNNLKKLPGIGVKTAQRIILELKDKIKTNNAIQAEMSQLEEFKVSQNIIDAIDALQVLGYSRKDIEKVINGKEIEELGVEEIIRIGLKELGK